VSAEGQVLGIDVGYSPTSRTTCFCLLRWDRTTARLRFRATTSDSGERRSALTDLLGSNRDVETVAVDGPLGPGLASLTDYRSAEACLSQGVMQKRGKPGQTSSPTGRSLHRHATELATLALDVAEVAAARHPEPIHQQCVVEAFPNAFLAAMVDDDGFPPLRRNASDVFWRTLATSGALDRLFEAMLPDRALTPDFASIADHEERAGVACALTALAVYRSDYVAVGDPHCGDIILPPEWAWGKDRTGEPWLRAVLGAAVGKLRKAPRQRRGFDMVRVLGGETFRT